MDQLHAKTRDERINQINIKDTVEPSPSQRAKYIYDELSKLNPPPTEWDLVCGCAEILGQVTLDMPHINRAVALVVRMIYEVHYFNNDTEPSCLSLENLKTSPTKQDAPPPMDESIGVPLSAELMIEKSLPFALD